MKRWILWIGGSLAVLVVGFLALALVLPRSAPFAFLQGHKPIEMAMPPQDRQKMEEMGMHFAVYSFKGTFDDVKARASNELVSEGYMDFGAFGVPPQKGKARQAAYMKGNMFAGMSGTTGSTPQIPDMQMVMIMEDTQITPQTPFSAGPDPSGKAKGWVSVVIMGKLEKTFFDRCKDWIGL